MSGNFVSKLLPIRRIKSFFQRSGRTKLEKILIPAAVLLLSVCIVFGILYFTKAKPGTSALETTTPAQETSVLGFARESSSKDETEPGSPVTETTAAATAAATTASTVQGYTYPSEMESVFEGFTWTTYDFSIWIPK